MARKSRRRRFPRGGYVIHGSGPLNTGASGGITELQSRIYAREEAILLLNARKDAAYNDKRQYLLGAFIVSPIDLKPLQRIADGPALGESPFDPSKWQPIGGGSSVDESTIGTNKGAVATFALLPALPDADYSDNDQLSVGESRITYRVSGNSWDRVKIRSFQREGQPAPDFPPVPFGVGQWHETLDGREFEFTATGWEEHDGTSGTTISAGSLATEDQVLTGPRSVIGGANPFTIQTTGLISLGDALDQDSSFKVIIDPDNELMSVGTINNGEIRIGDGILEAAGSLTVSTGAGDDMTFVSGRNIRVSSPVHQTSVAADAVSLWGGEHTTEIHGTFPKREYWKWFGQATSATGGATTDGGFWIERLSLPLPGNKPAYRAEMNGSMSARGVIIRPAGDSDVAPNGSMTLRAFSGIGTAQLTFTQDPTVSVPSGEKRNMVVDSTGNITFETGVNDVWVEQLYEGSVTSLDPTEGRFFYYDRGANSAGLLRFDFPPITATGYYYILVRGMASSLGVGVDGFNTTAGNVIPTSTDEAMLFKYIAVNGRFKRVDNITVDVTGTWFA